MPLRLSPLACSATLICAATSNSHAERRPRLDRCHCGSVNGVLRCRHGQTHAAGAVRGDDREIVGRVSELIIGRVEREEDQVAVR
jgi:hypothetical protein